MFDIVLLAINIERSTILTIIVSTNAFQLLA